MQFSITGAEGDVEYDIEVNDRDVARGEGTSGQFTMPSFGGSAKSVTVEAEIEDEEDETKVYRTLKYLGPAVAVTGPTGPQTSAPAPAQALAPSQPAAPSAPSLPGPAAATAVPASAAPAAKRRSKRRASKRGHRRTKSRRSHAPGSGGTKSLRRSRRDSAAKSTRSKRRLPRTAPLFDGVPEPGARKRPPSVEDTGGSKSGSPPAASVAGTAAAGTGSNSAAAVIVPALLAFISLVLAGTAVLRKRRVNG